MSAEQDKPAPKKSLKSAVPEVSVPSLNLRAPPSSTSITEVQFINNSTIPLTDIPSPIHSNSPPPPESQVNKYSKPASDVAVPDVRSVGTLETVQQPSNDSAMALLESKSKLEVWMSKYREATRRDSKQSGEKGSTKKKKEKRTSGLLTPAVMRTAKKKQESSDSYIERFLLNLRDGTDESEIHESMNMSQQQPARASKQEVLTTPSPIYFKPKTEVNTKVDPPGSTLTPVTARMSLHELIARKKGKRGSTKSEKLETSKSVDISQSRRARSSTAPIDHQHNKENQIGKYYEHYKSSDSTSKDKQQGRKSITGEDSVQKKSEIDFLQQEWEDLINLADKELMKTQTDRPSFLQADLKSPGEKLQTMIAESRRRYDNRTKKEDAEPDLSTEFETDFLTSKMYEKNTEYWNKMSQSENPSFAARNPSERYGYLSSYSKRYSIKRYLDKNPDKQDCFRRKLNFVNTARRPKSTPKERPCGTPPRYDVSLEESDLFTAKFVKSATEDEELKRATQFIDSSLDKLKARRMQTEGKKLLNKSLASKLKKSSEEKVDADLDTVVPLSFKSPSVQVRIDRVKHLLKEKKQRTANNNTTIDLKAEIEGNKNTTLQDSGSYLAKRAHRSNSQMAMEGDDLLGSIRDMYTKRKSISAASQSMDLSLSAI